MFLQTEASQKGLETVLYQSTEAGETHHLVRQRKAHRGGEEISLQRNFFLGSGLSYQRIPEDSYLEDCHSTLSTDDKALSWLKQATGQKTKFARCVLLIQSFKFTLVRCPRKKNKLPDYLSREPGP